MSRRAVLAFWIAAIVAFVGLRAVELGADAPRWLAYGGVAPEMLVEPTAKASEARNWAQFGAWKLSEADDYQFWRPQSPLWVYPLAGSFAVFGTSYETLRGIAIALGLIGLVALILWGHRHAGASGAVMAATLVAVDSVGIFWGRSGLLEPIVAAWLALAFLCLDRAFERLWWGVPALLALAAALGVKLAAAPAVPVFAIVGVVLLRRAPGVERPARARAAVIAVAAILAIAIVAWLATPEVQRTLAWNFQHMVTGRDGHTHFELDGVDADAVGAEVGDLPKRIKSGWLLFSAVLVLGVAEAGLRVRDAIRRRAGLRELLPVLWLVAFAVPVYAAAFFAYRFVLLLGPPLVVLAVGFVHRAAERERARGQPERARTMPWIATAIFAVCHLGAWGYGIAKLEREVDAAARVVQRRVDGTPDPVCIGLWSAPVVFETTCKHFYVKTGFNGTKEALRALRPTHLLLMPTNDDTRRILRRVWPEMLQRAAPRETLLLRGQRITLFEVPPALYDEPDAGDAAPEPKRRARPTKRRGSGAPLAPDD